MTEPAADSLRVELPEALRPELDPATRRRLFEEGIRLFDAGRFFDCHEVFEAIWRSTTPEPRDLFQGLIQVAVGLYHHLERDRPDVARRVLVKGRRRLETLPPVCHGLDVAGLIRQARGWENWLAARSVRSPESPLESPLESASRAAEAPSLPSIRIVDPSRLR